MGLKLGKISGVVVFLLFCITSLRFSDPFWALIMIVPKAFLSLATIWLVPLTTGFGAVLSWRALGKKEGAMKGLILNVLLCCITLFYGSQITHGVRGLLEREIPDEELRELCGKRAVAKYKCEGHGWWPRN